MLRYIHASDGSISDPGDTVDDGRLDVERQRMLEAEHVPGVVERDSDPTLERDTKGLPGEEDEAGDGELGLDRITRPERFPQARHGVLIPRSRLLLTYNRRRLRIVEPT